MVNQNVPRPSEYPPVKGKKMSKRLGGIIDCKYKTSSWHLNGFPDGRNIGLGHQTIISGRNPPLYYTLTLIAI